jgi:hypothetical protein
LLSPTDSNSRAGKIRLRRIGSDAPIGDEPRAFDQRCGRGAEWRKCGFRLGNEML